VTTAPDRAWLFPVLRAIPAAAVALAITFSADHSASLGYLALGSFATLTGIVVVVATLRAAYPPRPFLLQGALLVVGGVTAFIAAPAGLPVLLFLTTALFGATGIIELVAGLRARGRLAAARDWIFVGAASALFAIAVLLIPADFTQAISVPGKVVPPLTASVILVGGLGAYAAIVAVYLVIAGLSLKWAPRASTVSEA
jgi:uncharacterized membrane protein HdeD (DUF308 family)